MEFALLFLPLLASITSGFFGKYIGDRNSEIITSLFVSISALLSLFYFIKLLSMVMRVMWLLLLGLIQEHLM